MNKTLGDTTGDTILTLAATQAHAAGQAKGPLCWICGGSADSGEHKAKKSDLRAVYGTVTQAAPLILNDGKHKNRKVGSFDALAMKWPKSLCHACNTTRTQPHDRAWEVMSSALRGWTPRLRPGSVVRADRIFATDTARSMLAIHLYFVKAFGCLAVEAGSAAKINVPSLSEAIAQDRSHSDIYLAIGIPMQVIPGPIVAASDLSIYWNPRDGSPGLATWFYNVSNVCVLVAYAPDMALWAHREGLWHPRHGTNRLIVRDFAGTGDPSNSEYTRTAFRLGVPSARAE